MYWYSPWFHQSVPLFITNERRVIYLWASPISGEGNLYRLLWTARGVKYTWEKSRTVKTATTGWALRATRACRRQRLISTRGVSPAYRISIFNWKNPAFWSVAVYVYISRLSKNPAPAAGCLKPKGTPINAPKPAKKRLCVYPSFGQDGTVQG